MTVAQERYPTLSVPTPVQKCGEFTHSVGGASKATSASLAESRCVFTYSDPWPAGFVTGYEDAGGFVVEWLVALQRGILLPMLREGQRVARERGYTHVRFRLPHAFPGTLRLRLLALRLGCRKYHEDAEWVDYAWYP